MHPWSCGPCQQQLELETKLLTFSIVSWLLSKLSAISCLHCLQRKRKAACTPLRLHPTENKIQKVCKSKISVAFQGMTPVLFNPNTAVEKAYLGQGDDSVCKHACKAHNLSSVPEGHMGKLDMQACIQNPSPPLGNGSWNRRTALKLWVS